MPRTVRNQGRIRPLCIERKDYLSERKRGRILQKRTIPVKKTGKTGYNIAMTEQQEKKDEAPAPAPPVHKELPLDTRLLSETAIELNLWSGTDFNHFQRLIRYQVPA